MCSFGFRRGLREETQRERERYQERGRVRERQGTSERFLGRQLRVLTGRWSSLSYAKTYIELIRFILKFHFSFALTMAAFLMVAIFIVLVVVAHTHTHTQVVNLVSGTNPSGVSFPPSVSLSLSSLLSSSSARHEPRGTLRRRLFQLFSVAHCHLIYFLCVFALGLFFFCCSPPLKKGRGRGV